MRIDESNTSTMSSHVHTSTGATAKFQQASKARPIHRKAPVNVNPVVNRRMVVPMTIVATPMAILCNGFSIIFLANVKDET
jgi:hypothetical protein